MLAMLNRCVRETEDWLRYSPSVRRLLSGMGKLRAGLWRPRTPQALARSIRKLCASARLAVSDHALQTIQGAIHQRLHQLDEARLDWQEFVPDIDAATLAKAAILKPCLSPREKGAVFISFENQWVKLLRHGNLREFSERYNLVIAPSSSPHNLVNYVFPAAYPGPIFTLISNASDLAVLPRVSEKFVVVPLYASHWVNPERFQPAPRSERRYDLIMVASWGKVKRHHVLFRALQRMSSDLRVLLIGQDQDGRTAQTILDEARWYGVDGCITVLANQPFAAVTRALCQARASVVLSRREGSCVVVAESLFADTPMALLENAEIGSRMFINPQTGCFVEERRLAQQLTDLIAGADTYQPRRWAEANISCFASTRRLNDILKHHELSAGRDWTCDLAPLEWCPDPRLVRPQDRVAMEGERAELRSRFSLDLPATP